jgi:hypothetical protein
MMRAKIFRTFAGLIVLALLLSIGICLRDGAAVESGEPNETSGS